MFALSDNKAHFSFPKYRGFAGDPANFDITSALQFHLLTAFGLREFHYVLDIGCGPLSAGRFLIPYLLPERYFALEMQQGLIEQGVQFELGQDQLTLRAPQFLTGTDLHPAKFGVKFDYILGQSGLSRCPASTIEVCLQEAASCLRPDGIMVASFLPECGDGGSPEPACKVTQALAASAGLEMESIDWPHPAGEEWWLFHLPEAVLPRKPAYPVARPSFERVTELLIIEGAQPGFIESIQDSGDFLRVRGWAIHPETRHPATYVLFANAEGSIIATASVDIPRTDVAVVHGEQALKSGFRVRIPKQSDWAIESLVSLSFTRGETKAFALPAFY